MFKVNVRNAGITEVDKTGATAAVGKEAGVTAVDPLVSQNQLLVFKSNSPRRY